VPGAPHGGACASRMGASAHTSLTGQGRTPRGPVMCVRRIGYSGRPFMLRSVRSCVWRPDGTT
jgi:hypothetical protein